MSIKKQYIPAPLASAVKHGYVTDASEILDENKGKRQDEINQETDNEISSIKGDSTKSIADLSEDIANEAERASGVEAGLRESIDELGQIGLNPDNAISTDGDDFDGDTTAKRSKIPTIGAIIDGNPGIYDISKRNPTGGPNDDGTFTLEYILENADTLIPTSWRRGGMTISFVDSYDNKYVQYRLMSDTFRTTPANWQGVDDMPTLVSDNLVKSGGVEREFNTIKEELGLPTQNILTDDINTEVWMWQTGFLCGKDFGDYKEGQRNPISNSSSCSAFIPITEGKYSQLRYKRMIKTTSAGAASICFYTDVDPASVIKGAGEFYKSGETTGWEYSIINVPANAKYVRFGYLNEYIDTFECKGIYTGIVDNEGIIQDVEALQEQVGRVEEFVIEEDLAVNFNPNGYVCYKTSEEHNVYEGRVKASQTSIYSDFIDISKYKSLRYTNLKVTTAINLIIAGACFYTAQNEASVISSTGIAYEHDDTESFYEKEIVIPEGAKYVRFSFRAAYIEDFYCKGTYERSAYVDGLGKQVDDIAADVEALQEQVEPDEIRLNPIICRRRFYLAMTEWCKNHHLSDSVIIEGAGGGGIGGEVTDEQLGHGLAQYKVGDAAKILFNAYSYDFIANALCEKTHIAYTKGTTEVIELKSNSYDYFESYLPDYKPMVWKTGTGEKTVGIMDENYCNLCAICYSEDFNGNLVLGVIRSANSKSMRYVMLKALMDIAKKLINNDQAISSEVETLIDAGQGTNLDGATVYGNAIAIKVPIGNPKAFHQIDFNDINNPYIIYTYNANTPINTMSMIKLLTAMIVLDYIKDLDVFLTVTAEDRASVGTGAPSYNLLPEGCKITIRDLLYATLLSSSNVACYVLARYVGQFLIETYGDKGFIPESTQE